MDYIVKGTTPKLIYRFKHVDVSNIRIAILTIKQDGADDIEKDLASAIIDEDSIAWILTQEETLAFNNSIKIMLNWVLEDGTRGASKKTKYLIDNNYKEVVIV